MMGMLCLLMHMNNDEYAVNKTVPDELRGVILKALSFYPVLKTVQIDFVITNDIRKSVMQAQPHFKSMFFGKSTRRRYVVKISRSFELQGNKIPIQELPEDVLIGWIGHELGHIMDYLDKSNMELTIFGLAYISSPGFINSAERAADTYAVSNGLGEYILATKEFILHQAGMPDAYIRKMNKLYLPPEEIMRLMEGLKTKEEVKEVADRS